ncbi:MAG: hypothetical protein K2I83_03295, partial [Bacteroidales bacterium]|nr:hypothetical protein [Bacteroidales bacterium]
MFFNILISCAVAVFYAALLYTRNRKDELGKPWRYTLAAMRFAFVFLLCFVLFSPLYKIQRQEIRKPLCFVAVDKSASMQDVLTPASLSSIHTLCSRLENDFEVRRIDFGDAESTHYENLFNTIKQQTQGNPDACVLLISDGNVNMGADPLHAYRSCALPLFCIGMGDTTLHADTYIGGIQYNPYAFKGNVFPVRIQVGKRLLAQGKAKLQLSLQGEVLKESELDFGTWRSDETEIEYEIPASEAGVFRYQIALSAQEGERDLRNNTATFRIKVLESKRKILILGQTAHPDMGALARSLASSGKYETEVRTLQGSPSDFGLKQLREYDLILLHGLPSAREDLHRFDEVLREKPIWYIVSASTDLAKLSRRETGLSLTPRGGWNEAQASLSPDFSLFEIPKDEAEAYKRFPPLYTPFSRYETAPGGECVFYQDILQTPTRDPLFWLNVSTPYPVAVVTGHGLWRWRIADFQSHGNTRLFDRLTDRFVQLLSTEKPQENLVIQCPETLSSSENLLVRATLYNASFEKVGRADIRFVLHHEESGKNYDFLFAPDGDAYRLDAGTCLLYTYPSPRDK